MDNHNQSDVWQPCPAGELSRMTARLDALQSGARFRQLFGTGLLSMFLGAVAAVGLGGYVFYAEPAVGSISCKECQAHASEYREFLLQKNPNMDPALAKKLKKHLKKCNGCRAKFKKDYPDVPMDPLATCQPCLHRCVQQLPGDAPPAPF